MRKSVVLVCVALGGALAGTHALAGEGRPLRLIGEIPAATESEPKRFFIDAVVTPSDGPFKSEVEGWLTALPPDVGSGEITGSCVEAACALSVSLDEGTMALTGEMIGPQGPGAGRVQFADKPAGEVRFSALAGTAIDGVGELAPADAVTAAELTELLAWNGQEGGFNNTDQSGPPSDTERESLAGWQGSNGRPMTGLILTADLKALREGARAAKAAAGWTPIGDAGHGWTAGYPAAVLSQASRAGAEQRFASADGKAVLVIAVESPRSDADFDVLVDSETADRPGRDDKGYTRVNGDMEVSYTEGGVRRSAAYHSREGGFARVVFTYPADSDTYKALDPLVTRSLRVTRELKAQ